jgi:cation diffusion facilitator CzcD-associated flavoprotein CzcO
MNGVKPRYEVSDQWLGQPRPIRIIVVGAGISGIAAVKLFKERFTDSPTSMVLYEKNHDVGGTWLENRYPG